MSTQHDPKSLGKVTVATAGTPVPIKASAFMVKSVTIQCDPKNAGVYVYVKDSAGNIMATIGGGQSFTPPIVGVLDLSQIQLDVDTNNDGAFVSYA